MLLLDLTALKTDFQVQQQQWRGLTDRSCQAQLISKMLQRSTDQTWGFQNLQVHQMARAQAQNKMPLLGKQDTLSDQKLEEQDTSIDYTTRRNNNCFSVSSVPEEERHAAWSRIQKALDKASTERRSSKWAGECTRCDLYVRDLDFKPVSSRLTLKIFSSLSILCWVGPEYN